MKRAHEYTLQEWEAMLDEHPVSFIDQDDKEDEQFLYKFNRRITIRKTNEPGKRYIYREDYETAHGPGWGENHADSLVELLLKQVFQWRFVEPVIVENVPHIEQKRG